jgi:acyl carrier protein
MAVEEKIKEVFQKVLDVKPDEIEPGARLDESLGVDSTEMVEIAVGIKKALNVPIGDNELKKTHTFNEIVAIVEMKQSAGSHRPSCGCGH